MSHGAVPSCSGGHFEFQHAYKKIHLAWEWGMGKISKLAHGIFIGIIHESCTLHIFFSFKRSVVDSENAMIVIHNKIHIVFNESD